jgi:hypothetical protein
MLNVSSNTLQHAILETLAYSDVFDYPLCLDELHRYLTAFANIQDVADCIDSLVDQVGSREGFYFLKSRDDIVALRKQRERDSDRLFKRAAIYGRILGALPFVRMVALTGSLAVRNCGAKADFDFMLVAAKGRVWTARAFALLLNRMTRLLGDTLCPNLIISEQNLVWPHRDLYSAHELSQMIPLAGADVYVRLINDNAWVESFLPNARSNNFTRYTTAEAVTTFIQKILEFPLRGKLGNRVEAWEMKRKIARFTQQAGFGVETHFSADICQGNFQHHGIKTDELFRSRLSTLEVSVRHEKVVMLSTATLAPARGAGEHLLIEKGGSSGAARPQNDNS